MSEETRIAGRMLNEESPPTGRVAKTRPQVKEQGTEFYMGTEGKRGHANVRNDDGEMTTVGAMADPVAGADLTEAWTLVSIFKAAVAGIRALALTAGDAIIGRVKITDGTTVAAVDAVTQRLKVDAQLTGSIQTLASAPATGQKTVTATAAELFAGVSVRANRRRLRIKNEDPFLRLRIGPSSVTQQNGFPVEPMATVEFDFDPATPVAIFGISEGAALTVSVWEE